MKTKVLITAGLALLTLAGLCRWVLAPRWTQRMPQGWNYESHYIGIMTYPDPATGQFPDKDVTGIYERRVRITDESKRPYSILLEDEFVIKDLITHKITWAYTTHAEVDPRTGEHLAPQHRGDHAVFPRGVKKRTYRLRANYVKGVPLTFEHEHMIEGLRAYVFAYKGRGEYTEAYSGTKEYPGVKVQPGQEIKAGDDQFSYRVWVEPVTGELIKVEESSGPGDYIYDIATGQELTPVLRWSGETAGDDVLLRVERARAERWRILWTAWFAPGLISALGIVCAGLGAWRRKNESTVKTRDREVEPCRV